MPMGIQIKLSPSCALLRRAVIAGVIACLGGLVVWLSTRSQVEVNGDLSRQDVAELVRLSRAERRRDIIDFSAPPPQWSIRQVAYRWKRFRFVSASVVRVDQKSGHKAEVTIGTGTAMRQYQFVSTDHGWEVAKPAFE